MGQAWDFEINEKLDLVLERTIDVPPEKVWQAWTDERLLPKWFTPAPWKTVDCSIDLRPGGRFGTVMESPEGEKFPGEACYLEIVEHTRLIWTSAMGMGYRPQPAGMGGFLFTAAILLEKAPDGGTVYRVVAIHSNESDRNEHDAMGFHAGWGAALDQMVEMIKQG